MAALSCKGLVHHMAGNKERVEFNTREDGGRGGLKSPRENSFPVRSPRLVSFNFLGRAVF